MQTSTVLSVEILNDNVPQCGHCFSSFRLLYFCLFLQFPVSVYCRFFLNKIYVVLYYDSLLKLASRIFGTIQRCSHILFTIFHHSSFFSIVGIRSGIFGTDVTIGLRYFLSNMFLTDTYNIIKLR